MHNSFLAAYIPNVTAGNRGARNGAGEGRMKTMSRNTNNTLYSRYRRWRRYRETVRELQGLSGRELNDLGISRPDISRLAREAARL